MSLPEPLNLLSAEEQDTLAGFLEPCTFPAGEYIFRAGAAGDGCYLIDNGDVRLELVRRKLDSDGLDSDTVLGYLRAGSILGELSLLDRLPRSASACADTEVSARRLSSEAIEGLCATHPAIGVAILRALGRGAALKLRKTNERLAEHLVGDEVDADADAMVARAQAAQRAFVAWSDEQVDALLKDLAEAFAAKAEALARQAVQETRIGNVADKVDKNLLASIYVLESLNGKKAYGVLGTDEAKGVTEIAAPAGVIFGIIPMTNPAATAIYKTLIALKGRNALILSFQRTCMRTGNATGAILDEVLARHGAPEGLVQLVRDRNSRKKTSYFMSHKGVSLVLATGGKGMVEAAYSSGTPALGVGPGNTPVLIAEDADVVHAAQAIALSKAFDNGLICGAEHNLVVVDAVRESLIAAFEQEGLAVLSPEEAATFSAAAIRPDGGGWRRQAIGQTAQSIADFTGIKRDYRIKVIVVPAEFDLGSPYAEEKMLPVLSLFSVPDADAGIARCLELINHMGTGHTTIIHAKDEDLITRFGVAMPASRILVNSPGVHGIFGVTTGLTPSLTLGCGTFGGNSTTDNVTYRNLLNIKRLARFTAPNEEDF